MVESIVKAWSYLPVSTNECLTKNVYKALEAGGFNSYKYKYRYKVYLQSQGHIIYPDAESLDKKTMISTLGQLEQEGLSIDFNYIDWKVKILELVVRGDYVRTRPAKLQIQGEYVKQEHLLEGCVVRSDLLTNYDLRVTGGSLPRTKYKNLHNIFFPEIFLQITAENEKRLKACMRRLRLRVPQKKRSSGN